MTVRARIGQTWRDAESVVPVIDPFRNTTVGSMPVSTLQDCDDCLDAAVQATEIIAGMPGYERAALLRRAADEVVARAEAIGSTMARETGKAVRDCIAEVQRSGDTLRLCAEEAVRIQGEHIPMDASAIGAGKIGLSTRFPVGVVAAITPFNGPVNLAAHKVGPALAAGNAVVVKPSPKAPLSAHLFLEAVIGAGVPDGVIGTLYGDTVSAKLVADSRVDFVSFTGSIPVGKIIRSSMGMKRAALELGGVGPTFVHHDADIATAAAACARNGVLLAGQSCVSVQNVYVERTRYDEFCEAVKEEVARIRFGDPLDPDTEVGTLIDESAAKRVEALVDRATSAGATSLCSGTRRGAALPATVLTDVTDKMDVVTDEIFGPVITIQAYDDIEPIFRRISDSPFGLQCGIYTDSMKVAMSAFRNVRTGGVILNGTSRWRSDQMPYGGVKDSGIGREGPKFAIRDMTEERLLVIN
ncbi:MULTISPECIES: aldehyde dehydrogenase family protein [Nocardiaceae]|uniref:aldehyde dehydrogenase family protein n=1 Tax=Nocardiaceae TaxID=85025 RepID=UPI000522E49C|nr:MULTISPECIES: aldehyde dehydrogenase family protein [Rhodococcus]